MSNRSDIAIYAALAVVATTLLTTVCLTWQHHALECEQRLEKMMSLYNKRVLEQSNQP